MERVCSCLIDGEANGVEVLSEAPLPSSVLLHEANQDSAAVLTVMRLIVQLDEELRV